MYLFLQLFDIVDTHELGFGLPVIEAGVVTKLWHLDGRLSACVRTK